MSLSDSSQNQDNLLDARQSHKESTYSAVLGIPGERERDSGMMPNADPRMIPNS